MSIFRLDVGVQGSTEPTSLPFLGVVSGPMTNRPLSSPKIAPMISLVCFYRLYLIKGHHPKQVKKKNISIDYYFNYLTFISMINLKENSTKKISKIATIAFHFCKENPKLEY